MSERQREELARPWRVRQLEELARISRPLRTTSGPEPVQGDVCQSRPRAWERPTHYLEIGVRDGESFRLAKADVKIGIDPERMANMATLQPGEQLFETTSDEFFAEHAPRVLEPESVRRRAATACTSSARCCAMC